MFETMENAITERLRAKLQDATVITHDEADSVPELRQKAPFVAVIYDGFDIAETIAEGRIANIEHQWLIVCGAKTARARGNPIDARNQAGDIALRVVGALAGFAVGSGRRMRLEPSLGPEYDGGFCYMPLQFSVRATIKGDQD